MENNPEFDRQVQQYREAAQQTGISGAVYVDVDSAHGFLRLKLKVTPLEQRANLTTGLATAIEMMVTGLGLQCYRHQ